MAPLLHRAAIITTLWTRDAVTSAVHTDAALGSARGSYC